MNANHHDSLDTSATVTSRKGRPIWLSWLHEVAGILLPAVVIAVLVNLFLAQSTVVHGHSMETNLLSDQRLVIEKLSYHFHGPRRGDIVVLKLEEWDGDPLIKRVIGLPGETVAIHDGQVFIDGIPLDEPYLDQPTLGNWEPQVVPPLHIFVMGDNRAASNDSRYFGAVPLDRIVGRAWLRYWPPQEIGFVR